MDVVDSFLLVTSNLCKYGMTQSQGQVMLALGDGALTTTEIADKCNLSVPNTSNVIKHLIRYGECELVGKVRGIRKPSHVYRLTEAGREMLRRVCVNCS